MRYDLLIGDMIWSYSRLTAYEDCPYMWLKKYIPPVSESQSKFFAEFGNLIHRCLQKYLCGEVAKADLPLYYLSHFQTDVTSRAPSEKIYLSYLEQGLQYCKVLPFPNRKILKVEDKLQFQFAGYPFVGFLDVLSEDLDGKLYITDHKSRALKPRSHRAKPTLSDLELDQYQRQLYIYAHAVHELCGRYPDVLEFNCYRTGVWIAEPFRQERLKEVESWASALIEKIACTGEWKANTDYWFCKHLCDCSADCEYYSRN